MHAAFEQRLGFAFGVEIVSHFFVIDFERHGVERKKLTHIHRNEHSDLGVSGEQQFFFQHEQFAIQVEHVFLERLDFLIEALEFLGWRGCGCSSRSISGGWCGRRRLLRS
jgi:hypothetical protein